MTRSEGAVDSPFGAASRAAMELIAWIAAPWAAVAWSPVLAVVVLVVLVTLPSMLNVPGDKHRDGHAVSGATRIAVEILLFGSAVLGAALVWPAWAALSVAGLALIAIVTNLPRWRWLTHQAPFSP